LALVSGLGGFGAVKDLQKRKMLRKLLNNGMIEITVKSENSFSMSISFYM